MAIVITSGGSAGGGGGPITAPLDGSGFVEVNQQSALPAGTNVIGHVIVDSAAGVVVTTLPALPAGANVIGHVISDAGSVVQLATGGNVVGAVTQSAGPWTQNLTQLASTAIDVNSGAKSAGTQRVVLATDQPALTAALKVDPSGVTSPVSLAALPALVAGTALAGQVAAVPGMAQVIDSTGVARAVASAFANVAASQTDSVIKALSGALTTYVYAVVCVAGGTATNITFNSKPSGAGSAISPLFANAANGGVVLPFTGSPWFQSASSAGISVTTGAGSTTGVLILYAQF